MKFAVAFAIAAVVAVAAFLWSHRKPALSPVEAAHAEWRRTTVEKVTAERPARFEAMKWHPDQDVELRAPASTKKSQKSQSK